MPANVTVHYKAQSDQRIVFLAKLLGVTVDDAFGKMVRLWSVMTELQTDTPDVDHVNAIMLDLRGAELLVKSGLAEQLEDGAIRVKGRVDNETNKDRLEWYGALHERNVKGGIVRSNTADRDGRGRFAPGSPPNSPASPAPDPRSDQILSGSGSDPSGASGSDPRGDRDREPTEAELGEAEGLVLPPNPPLRAVPLSPMVPITGQLEQSLDHVTNTRGIGTRIWERLERLRNEIAAELGVEIRPLHPMDAGTRALGMRIREASLKLDAQRIEADLNHVLDVVAAEARTTRSVQWLTGAIFEERPFRRALGMTLDDAKRQRGPTTTGPRTPPTQKQPEQPRRIPTLTKP